MDDLNIIKFIIQHLNDVSVIVVMAVAVYYFYRQNEKMQAKYDALRENYLNKVNDFEARLKTIEGDTSKIKSDAAEIKGDVKRVKDTLFFQTTQRVRGRGENSNLGAENEF